MVGKLYLEQAYNTLGIGKEWGYYDIDNIRVEALSPSEIHNVSADLVTSPPSLKTDIVYNLLSHPEISTSADHYLEFDFESKPAGLYILKVKNWRSVEVSPGDEAGPGV